MKYTIKEENGQQVIICAMTEEERKSVNADVWQKVQKAKSLGEFCKVLEWAGSPIKMGDNPISNPTKLQHFAEHYGIELQTEDLYKPTTIKVITPHDFMRYFAGHEGKTFAVVVGPSVN